VGYTKTDAKKDGWTFYDGMPERHDGGWGPEIVLPTYAATKLVGDSNHIKEHPSEDQLLQDIEAWEARQGNPPSTFVDTGEPEPPETGGYVVPPHVPLEERVTRLEAAQAKKPRAKKKPAAKKPVAKKPAWRFTK
jgi:hypothetical protein